MAQKTFKGLPLYAAELENDNCGVIRVSLVDAPAVEIDFLSYSAAKRQDYAIADEEKRRVFGCVLRADYPIYRRDHGMEYYITFSAEQIRAFAQKYLAEGRQNNVDLDHDGNEIQGAEMVQYFIKDTEAGLAPASFDDIADGSLFAEYQITDDDLWQRIKDGEFKGFSVEIVHVQTPVEYNTNKSKMNTLFERIKTALVEGLAAVESELAAQEQASQFKSVATDNGTLIWETEDDLKAGDKVYIEDAEGNRVAAADGEYKTEDNKTIVVADGAVSEIKDTEAEVAPEGEGQQGDGEKETKLSMKDRFMQVKAAFSFNVDELWIKAYALVPDGNGIYNYIVAMFNDYFIMSEYNENANTERYVRYDYTLAEDGTMSLNGEGVEVEMVWQTKGEKKDDAAAQYAAKDNRIAELEAALAEAEAKLKEPQGKSAHDAYQQQINAPKQDDFAEMMKRVR